MFEYLENVLPRSADRMLLKVHCQQCDTINHWPVRQIRTMRAGVHGAAQAICFDCGAQQYDIPLSCVVEDALFYRAVKGSL
jgi:hypothetical protein